jgi:hypothetical protein
MLDYEAIQPAAPNDLPRLEYTPALRWAVVQTNAAVFIASLRR